MSNPPAAWGTIRTHETTRKLARRVEAGDSTDLVRGPFRGLIRTVGPAPFQVIVPPFRERPPGTSARARRRVGIDVGG